MMNPQSGPGGRRLLVMDLDGSLVGGSAEYRDKLFRALEEARDSFTLVYVSGRSLSEQIETINESELLLPDYIISNVGTEIHRMPGEHPLEEWYRYVRAGFDRQAIVEYFSNRSIESSGKKLSIQPETQQTPLKVSYYLEDAQPDLLDQIQQELFKDGFLARMVYSYRLYLDFIPERAGIGAAVKFLADSLVLFPNQVFVTGDSAKDIDLFQYGFRGIVVGNATRELKQAVELRAYFSHGKYAEGVLEGLKHYKFFEKEVTHQKPEQTRIAFDRAIESLHRNITPMGFSAASLKNNPMTDSESNYFAVWSRDGIKTGLWSLCLNEPEVTECFRRTLELMAEHQTPSGQIPSNVQLKSKKPDYGGIGEIASIDSVIWYVIGACRYAAHEGDREFLKQIYPSLDLAMRWLRAHDSNNNGLIELPESSDWMDLFPRSYNVLYDEVLWYLASRDFGLATKVLGKDAKPYEDLSETIRSKIIRRFWPTARKLSETKESFSEKQFTLGDAQYMLAQISPFDFSWRCDVYANLMAALVGLLDEQQLDQVFSFLWGVGVNEPFPVKCLYPPVHSGANDWKDYFITNFLNLPDHYHNGGIWPFIGGLWVRFLAKCDRLELAFQELHSLAESCRVGIYGEWEFNEWLHGKTGRPMGKAHQAWSAASYIAAYSALHRETSLSGFDPLTEDMFI